VFLFEFVPEKWRIVLRNLVSARVYHEVFEDLAESIRNFCRKAGMFSIFGRGNTPASSG
jgi:hypothetical protein